FRHQDLAERAFVDRLDLHGRLVSLDLGDHVAGLHPLALFLQPFGEVALLHRGRQRGHEDFDRHDVSYTVTWGGARLAVDIRVELGNLRLLVVRGEFGGLVDAIAHLRVDLLQLVFAGKLGLENTVAHLLDRIVLGAHLLHLFLGAIFGGVGHRVSAIAVGEHFENVRALALAAPFHRLLASGFDRTHIHAVDLLTGKIERSAALRQIDLRRGARDRGAHGIAIVFDHVDHGKLPKLRHVEALVDLALIGSAVAEIGEAHIVVAAVAIGESKTGAERDLCADDAVSTEEALLDGEHMHRAAFAPRVATAASGELGHHTLRIHAAGEHVTVIAVAGDDLVAFLERHLHADDDSFLADVEMAETADEAHAIKLAGLLLEAADQQHVAIGRKLLRLGECRRGVGSVSFLFLLSSGHDGPYTNGAAAGGRRPPHSPKPFNAEAPQRATPTQAIRTKVWKETKIARSARVEQQSNVARVAVVEERPGTLVQHVRIDLVGAQKGDAALPGRVLELEARQLDIHLGDLAVEILLRAQSVVAGKRVDAEITDVQGCKRIQAQCGQNRTPPTIDNHPP